jgi:hypothetical protein
MFSCVAPMFSCVAPMSSCVAPGGAMSHPGGAMSHPGGAMLHPAGAMLHPAGAMLHPAGAMLHPAGAMLHPAGAMPHCGATRGVRFCGARRTRAPDWGTPDEFPRPLLHMMPSPLDCSRCMPALLIRCRGCMRAGCMQSTAHNEPVHTSSDGSMIDGAELSPHVPFRWSGGRCALAGSARGRAASQARSVRTPYNRAKRYGAP